MFRQLGAPEIILILVVLVLLFGAKRLPDAARSLGRSMRIFKTEVKEMRTDEDSSASHPAAQPPREVEGRIIDRTDGVAGQPAGERVTAPDQTDRDR